MSKEKIEVEFVKGKIGQFEKCDDGIYRKITRSKKETCYKINNFKTRIGTQYQVVKLVRTDEKELGVFLNRKYAEKFIRYLKESKIPRKIKWKINQQLKNSKQDIQ